MTKQEAKKRFGIKETEPIKKDGVLYLLRNAEERSRVWSLSSAMREELRKDIEAYKALLNEQ